MAGPEGFQPGSRIELFVNKENKIEIGSEKINVEFVTRRTSGRMIRSATQSLPGAADAVFYATNEWGRPTFNKDGPQEFIERTFLA